MENKQWYKLTAEESMKVLGVAGEGLSAEEAKSRLEKFGPNQLNAKKPESLFLIFLQQFKSSLIYILLAASAVSFYLGKTNNAVVILCVLLINAVMGFIQESRAKKLWHP